MSDLWQLSALAMRGLVSGARQAVGFAAGDTAAAPVARFLTERFIDQGQRLTRALEQANDHAWHALEYSLAGESLWERCTTLFSRADDKAFREQVRTFLDNVPPSLCAGDSPEFRRHALAELRLARQEGFLRVSSLDVRQLARQAGRFASYASPLALLAAERQALAAVAASFPGDHFRHLRQLLEVAPADETPLLTAAVRYFFRREVEEDQELFQGLAFVLLEQQSAALEVGLRNLAGLLTQHEQRLQQMMGEILLLAGDTYKEVQQISHKLDQLLQRRQLAGRELRLDDTMLSISEEERRLVRDLVKRYRSLPEEQRTARVELALKVGAAEAVTGYFAEAKKDFDTAALLSHDVGQQAEAHASAFQAALSQRDFDGALGSLLEAARLDANRFSPFPIDKYRPERILGAGGFGAAFLCRHAFTHNAIVVKALWTTGLDRTIDEVFNEAQVLSSLSHPAVVQVIDCDFADRNQRSRPYVVMEYFDGESLASHVEAHGPMTPEAFLPLARQIAEGLRAAHDHKVYHRDVKPANLLVRRVAPHPPTPPLPQRGEGGASPPPLPASWERGLGGEGREEGWEAKLIDFGLALRPETVAVSRASTEQARRSLLGTSIAGTYKYAAPEQLGEAPGVSVAAHSDVYAFGRTCYFALLGTPEPDDDDKETLPEGWKKFLSRCTARKADRRPASFAEVLQELNKLAPASSHAAAEPLVLMAPPLQKILDLQPMPLLEPLYAPPRTPVRDRPRRPARPARLGGAGARLRATTTATLSGHTGTVSVVAFSPDGRTLVTGSFDDRLRLWSTQDGEGGPWLIGHGGDVNAAAFSPDGRMLATSGDDRTVRLWRLPDGRPREAVLMHPDRVYSVAFSPDGKLLASACDDGRVRLWSMANGTLKNSVAAHASFVRHIAFSPDGKLLASASGDRTVRLWHAADEKPHATLTGHAHTVWSAAFSPDGRYLATASQDRTARVWNVGDGQLLFTLEGHSDIVWSVAFSPDGRLLATGSHDKTVRLWEMPEGRCLTTLEGHTGLVRYLAFSPDGRTLATASGDNTARLWMLHDADENCDWSPGEPLLPPRPKVTLTLAGHGEVYPGDELWLDVAVENAGRGDLVQLRADMESCALPQSRLSALFGRVKPGETVSRCLSALLPVDHPSGELRGQLVFREGNGYQPPPQPVVFTIKPFPRADLGVTWRLVDDGSGNSFGNGDGKPQRGECLDVAVTLQNDTGRLLEGLRLSLVGAQLPSGVVINIPRAELPPLPDGACAEGRVTFSIRPTAALGPARMELRVETGDGLLFAVLPIMTVIE